MIVVSGWELYDRDALVALAHPGTKTHDTPTSLAYGPVSSSLPVTSLNTLSREVLPYLESHEVIPTYTCLYTYVPGHSICWIL